MEQFCFPKAFLLLKHFSTQVRSRLAHERSVKLDAFQWVEELQSQLNDVEQSSTQRNSPGGKDTLSLGRISSQGLGRGLEEGPGD